MSKLKSPDRNNKSTVFSDITKKFQGVVAGGAGGEQPAYTQLLHAAADGHVDVVRQLLQNGANVDAHDDVHMNSALHEASWKGYSQTIDVLCKHKANLYLKNRLGHTALHLACQQGHNQSCRILLLNGCKPDIKNNFGDTPLHSAARYGHAGVVRILLSAFCNVNEVNKNGDTALHISAAMGRKKLTRILLESGANPAIQNKQGETAMSICIRKGYQDVQEIIANPPPLKPPTVATAKTDAVKTTAKREKDGSQGSSDKKRAERFKKTKSGSSRSVHFTPDGQKSGAKKLSKHRLSGSCDWSPYGCHMHPNNKDFPQPKLDSLPDDPLTKGEQYYIDLAGNIRKGPVGRSNKCFCKPLIEDVEKRMEKDKQELIEHIDFAHEDLTEKICSLEKKTHKQLVSINEAVSQKLANERLECNERVQRTALKERIESQRRQRVQVEALKGEVKTWLNSKMDGHRRSCGEQLDQYRDPNHQNHIPYQKQVHSSHNPYYYYHQNFSDHYGRVQPLERTISHVNVQHNQQVPDQQIQRPNSSDEVLNNCVNSDSQLKKHLKPISRSKSDMYLTISVVSESEDEDEEDGDDKEETEDRDVADGDENEENEENHNRQVSDDHKSVPKVDSTDDKINRRPVYGSEADNSVPDLNRLGARPKEPLRIRTNNDTINEVNGISDQNSGSSLEMSSHNINGNAINDSQAINQNRSRQPIIDQSLSHTDQILADIHLSADLMKTLRCNGSVTVGGGTGDPSADSPFNDSGYRTKFSPSPREVPLLTTATVPAQHLHTTYAEIHHTSNNGHQQFHPKPNPYTHPSHYQSSHYASFEPPIGLPAKPQPMRKLSLTHYTRPYSGPNSSLV